MSWQMSTVISIQKYENEKLIKRKEKYQNMTKKKLKHNENWVQQALVQVLWYIISWLYNIS